MKLYYFSEMPHHEYPDEEAAKYPALRLEFPNAFFKREKAADNYRRFLDEYEYADEVGFDGLTINEHHSTPSCVDVSVNMTAGILARTTKRAKILLLGNILPIQENPPYEPLRITEKYLTRLEGWCDEFNERLPKLTSFILPGGTPGAAFLHQARTVSRRAERSAWALIEAEPDATNPIAVKYLNRLSDLLFILARLANPDGDILWQPGGAP